jgi:regulatory protein
MRTRTGKTPDAAAGGDVAPCVARGRAASSPAASGDDPPRGPSLYDRALAILMRQERSRAELERRLAPHAQSAEEVAGVLAALEERGWLSDRRVAESLAHRKGGRLGVRRIEQELRNRGVEDGAIDSVVPGLRESELARARGAWRKRFRALPQDTAERARQWRFLQARGFDAHVIRQVLAGTGEEDA